MAGVPLPVLSRLSRRTRRDARRRQYGGPDRPLDAARAAHGRSRPRGQRSRNRGDGGRRTRSDGGRCVRRLVGHLLSACGSRADGRTDRRVRAAARDGRRIRDAPARRNRCDHRIARRSVLDRPRARRARRAVASQGGRQGQPRPLGRNARAYRRAAQAATAVSRLSSVSGHVDDAARGSRPSVVPRDSRLVEAASRTRGPRFPRTAAAVRQFGGRHNRRATPRRRDLLRHGRGGCRAHHSTRADDGRLGWTAQRQAPPSAVVGHVPASARRILPRARPVPAGNRRAQDDGPHSRAVRHRTARTARGRSLRRSRRVRSGTRDRSRDVREPDATPEGIEHVFVNGRAVLEHGRHTGARPGWALRRDVQDRLAATRARAIATTGPESTCTESP